MIMAGVISSFLMTKATLLPSIAGGGILIAVGYFLQFLDEIANKLWFQIVLAVSTLGIIITSVIWLVYRIKNQRKEIRVNHSISENMITARKSLYSSNDSDAVIAAKVLDRYLEEWNVDDNGVLDSNLMDKIETRRNTHARHSI